jgi:bifunctional non-homologous end joining protein LigD
MPALVLADVEPMLLGERDVPPAGPGWTAEIKYDGYRVLAGVSEDGVHLKTRNGADATRWYPELQSLATLPAGTILDGEVCVLDDIGRPNFERLQARSRRRSRPAGAEAVVFCAFDVLVYRGRDLREMSLLKRKAKLKELLAQPVDRVLLVQDLPDQVAWLYEQALALQLEGIVAKRLDSPYLSGRRSDAWLKIKRRGAIPAQRFAI